MNIFKRKEPTELEIKWRNKRREEIKEDIVCALKVIVGGALVLMFLFGTILVASILVLQGILFLADLHILKSLVFIFFGFALVMLDLVIIIRIFD